MTALRSRRVDALRLIAAATLAGGPSIAAAQNATPVRVATTPDENALPVVWALRSGRFREAGLDVRIERLANGSQIAAGVAGGSYEVGKASTASLFSAHLRNVPFVFVAPAGLYDAKAPYGLVLVRADSPIRTAKDLEGKTLSTGALNSIDVVAVDAWMEKNGADWRKLRFVELPISQAQAAIEAGRVDAANINRPQLDAALSAGTMRVFAHAYDGIGTSYLTSAWFTLKSWTAKEPHAAARFGTVVEEAARYTNEHHAETAALVAEFSGIPLEVVQHNARALFGTSLDGSLIQPVIDAAAKYGLLQRPFPAQELLFSG